jgi:hypothetical protein
VKDRKEMIFAILRSEIKSSTMVYCELLLGVKLLVELNVVEMDLGYINGFEFENGFLGLHVLLGKTIFA